MKLFILFGSVLLLLIFFFTKNQEKGQTRLFVQLDAQLKYFVEKIENKEFGETRCIDVAKGIADNILEKLPGDKVSYCGYNNLKTPSFYSDASVAAIENAAPCELAALDVGANTFYLDTANTIIKLHNSKKYCVVDVPVNYTDYYYLKILKRQDKL